MVMKEGSQRRFILTEEDIEMVILPDEDDAQKQAV